MQIERTGTSVVAAAGKAGAAEIQTTKQDSSKATSATAAAAPLTGGKLTTPLGVFDDPESYLDLPPSFTDLVAEKTRLFSTKLTDLFKAMDIRMDEPITLSIDSIGKVTASGPGKEKIEKLFEDNPEFAKQLKEVMMLQGMLAMKAAVEAYMEAKKKAGSDEERAQADQAFLNDMGSVKALQHTMVLSEGGLTSAALAFMNDRYAGG